MARSINDIMNNMYAAKAAQPDLDSINSPSATAHWRLWIYIIAYVTWTLENLWDIYQSFVSGIAQSSRTGTSLWWVDKIQEFQYGDDLQVLTDDNGKKYLGYATVDSTKQIVKRFSISPSGNGSAFIKVASDDGSGNIVPFTTDQLSAFSYYADRIMPPGANVGVKSAAADLAKFYISIYYNPLLGADTIKAAVKDAINNYLSNLGNARFDGSILLSDILIAIKAVAGVVDAKITDAQAKSSTGAYNPIDRIYQTVAGYIQIDPAFPLDDTLTMIAS